MLLGLLLCVFGLVLMMMGWETLHARDGRTSHRAQAYGWLALGLGGVLAAVWLAW